MSSLWEGVVEPATILGLSLRLQAELMSRDSSWGKVLGVRGVVDRGDCPAMNADEGL